MKKTTKWKLYKFLTIAGIVLVVLLLFPVYAIFLPNVADRIDIRIFMYAHYGALAAVVFFIIMLGYVEKPEEDNNADKQNPIKKFFETITSTRTNLVAFLIALALVFAVGYGISYRINKEIPPEPGYVINIKTKRIHSTSCKYIATMNKENMRHVTVYKSPRQNVDYIPCQHCLPEAYYEYHNN